MKKHKNISELTEKEIIERIKKEGKTKITKRGTARAKLYCSKDFADVAEQFQIRRLMLLPLLIYSGEPLLSQEAKEGFRDRRSHLEKAAKSLKPLIDKQPLAESMVRNSLQIKSFIKKNGQKTRLDLLLKEIHKRNEGFDRWEALSRVLKVVGIHITGSGLQKKADRYRTGENL